MAAHCGEYEDGESEPICQTEHASHSARGMGTPLAQDARLIIAAREAVFFCLKY